ncbi:MAG: hypothetical protein VKJ46_01455 [Leptolyngbyaceae bacterium]|nr:hypothetical protein [Leptolyngbyaceae bacterium]
MALVASYLWSALLNQRSPSQSTVQILEAADIPQTRWPQILRRVRSLPLISSL